MTARTFAIRYAPGIGALLGAMGLGQRTSGVTVDDDAVRVTMGWGFRGEVPRDRIRDVEVLATGTPNLGVHGSGGVWLVNGSPSGLVRLWIHPSARGRVLGVPARLDQLTISLEDPAGFAAVLARRSGDA